MILSICCFLLNLFWVTLSEHITVFFFLLFFSFVIFFFLVFTVMILLDNISHNILTMNKEETVLFSKFPPCKYNDEYLGIEVFKMILFEGVNTTVIYCICFEKYLVNVTPLCSVYSHRIITSYSYVFLCIVNK